MINIAHRCSDLHLNMLFLINKWNFRKWQACYLYPTSEYYVLCSVSHVTCFVVNHKMIIKLWNATFYIQSNYLSIIDCFWWNLDEKKTIFCITVNWWYLLGNGDRHISPRHDNNFYLGNCLWSILVISLLRAVGWSGIIWSLLLTVTEANYIVN